MATKEKKTQTSAKKAASAKTEPAVTNPNPEEVNPDVNVTTQVTPTEGEVTMKVVDETKPGVKKQGESFVDDEIFPESKCKDSAKVKYAKKILEQSPALDAVYLIDGLFYSDLKRAKGRAEATKGAIYRIGK